MQKIEFQEHSLKVVAENSKKIRKYFEYLKMLCKKSLNELKLTEYFPFRRERLTDKYFLMFPQCL